jgi:hypothetical protein
MSRLDGICGRQFSPTASRTTLVVTGSSGAQSGYALKLVRGKEPPSTVVGDDGSICRLTTERFARVKPGKWLACEWTIAPDTTASNGEAGA